MHISPEEALRLIATPDPDPSGERLPGVWYTFDDDLWWTCLALDDAVPPGLYRCSHDNEQFRSYPFWLGVEGCRHA